MAALIAVPALLVALPASASTSVTIVSSSSYVDSIDYRHVVGEVRNTGTTNVDSVELTVTFHDAGGRLLETSSTYSALDILAPGERAPFHAIDETPPGYDHYELSLSSQATTAMPNHNFTTTVSNEYTDSIDYRHIVGTVRNDNTTTARFVEPVITLYDASGTVVGTDFTFVKSDDSSSLGAKASAPFEFAISTERPWATYRIVTESSTPPAYDTTGAPSASASPTGTSPTTNPSPAPAHEVPSVTVSPFVVRYGQTAYVTISGTPGAVIDLYIRKYRADFVKIRDGLVLDASGQTTVATKPDMNLRFMAKDRAVAEGSSIGGTSGLMTVEKQVSINVSRVGTNRFTFSGSINPNHPGAVVNLYRNGSLLKAGIPVNSSRVYTFTGVLPSGSADFRVTSPVTGYNNASHSPVRTVRIY